MVKMVRDKTGRFQERPHYTPDELDRECEHIITNHLRRLHGRAQFPVDTDDLTKLIESDAEDLDLYADLSSHGPDVEGITEFRPGHKPAVLISKALSNDARRENRLRTTLTHEYGHVRFHGYLFSLASVQHRISTSKPSRCKRETMLNAAHSDWMEWQAGYVCGALLMPRSHVRRLVEQFRENFKIRGLILPDTDQGHALILVIVREFRVSSDAARVRLAKLGHVSRYRPLPLFN